MIRMTILYPNTPGSRFDHDYYSKTHLGTLARELLGPALLGVEVDTGVAGPQGPAPYHAIGHLLFESMPAFQQVFGPAAPKLAADVANYTDVAPVVHFGQYEKL